MLTFYATEQQAMFVGLNLGPTLEASGFGSVKIMIMVRNLLQFPIENNSL